jgi:hypothetical protein
MQLTLLAPGSRANAVVDVPVTLGFAGGDSRFQLYVDDQEVTSTIAGSSQGEPRFSREAMAEFELISNRFDATQGRSIGVQVNAITKSGTNLYSGTKQQKLRPARAEHQCRVSATLDAAGISIRVLRPVRPLLLRTRHRWNQIVQPVVRDEQSIVFSGMLDDR